MSTTPPKDGTESYKDWGPKSPNQSSSPMGGR